MKTPLEVLTAMKALAEDCIAINANYEATVLYTMAGLIAKGNSNKELADLAYQLSCREIAQAQNQ